MQESPTGPCLRPSPPTEIRRAKNLRHYINGIDVEPGSVVIHEDEV